jgi:hypothetical protein
MAKDKHDREVTGAEGQQSFGRFLATLEHGDAERDLSRILHETNKRLDGIALDHITAKAEITVKISFLARADGQTEVKVKPSVKINEPARATSIRWLTPGGNLIESDPRQEKLPLRTVKDDGTVREIEDKTADVREIGG